MILYGSSYLQRAAPQNLIAISSDDLNGFMSVIYGMGWRKGLTLVLHTLGGDPTAAETMVQYLRSKFESVEVVVSCVRDVSWDDDQPRERPDLKGPSEPAGPIDPPFVMNVARCRLVGS